MLICPAGAIFIAVPPRRHLHCSTPPAGAAGRPGRPAIRGGSRGFSGRPGARSRPDLHSESVGWKVSRFSLAKSRERFPRVRWTSG